VVARGWQKIQANDLLEHLLYAEHLLQVVLGKGNAKVVTPFCSFNLILTVVEVLERDEIFTFDNIKQDAEGIWILFNFGTKTDDSGTPNSTSGAA